MQSLDLKLSEILLTLREACDCCQLNSGFLKELKQNLEKQGFHCPHYSDHDRLKKTKPVSKPFYPMHRKYPNFSKNVVGYESQSASGSLYTGFKEEHAVAIPYMYDPSESSLTDHDLQGFIDWLETTGR